jgi:hypothetical protein
VFADRTIREPYIFATPHERTGSQSGYFAAGDRILWSQQLFAAGAINQFQVISYGKFEGITAPFTLTWNSCCEWVSTTMANRHYVVASVEYKIVVRGHKKHVFDDAGVL